MLGHKWEPAQGTVLSVRAHPGSGHDGARHPEQHYQIEAQLSAGGVVRALVIDKNEFAHPVGAKVAVEVNAKTSEIRFDPGSRAADPSPGFVNIAQGIQNLTGPPAAVNISGTAGIAEFFGALAAGQPGGASVHVVSSGGQDVQVAMDGGEISNLAQAMISGDPAAKQAAMQRIQQIKAQAQQQVTDQPPAPDLYQPAAPPFGSFDTGQGQGSQQERLARLQQLLDRGILTESEFEAQRQQVLGGP
jgi:Short C-terminal domain